MSNEKDWFLLQLKPNAFRIAERNLSQQNFQTFLPLQQITKRKNSSFIKNLKPLFPGYMFVTFDRILNHWKSVNSTYGVSRIVFNGDIPKPLPYKLVDGLIKRCNKFGIIKPLEALNKGDSVEIMDGPFSNFLAIVDKIDENKRIWVLLDFMGQNSRVQIKHNDLQSKG